MNADEGPPGKRNGAALGAEPESQKFEYLLITFVTY